MLKKLITYEDYNGQTQTEPFYFNLDEAELVELEVSSPEGFVAKLHKVIASDDHKQIIDTFKQIILMAYGKKSEDGRRFIKSEELRIEFTQMPAYSVLFIELATDADAAATFINGLVPAKLAQKVAAAQPVQPDLTTAVTKAVRKDVTAMSHEELLELAKRMYPEG